MMKKTLILAAALAGFATSAFASSAVEAPQHAKPGFYAAIEDGRLWVFKADSKELAQFKEHGEPAVSVARIGSGPDGMTLKAPSEAVMKEYLGEQ